MQQTEHTEKFQFIAIAYAEKKSMPTPTIYQFQPKNIHSTYTKRATKTVR